MYPKMKSMIKPEWWEIYHSEPDKFRQKVKDYFALGYPDWTVTRASYKDKLIYLERRG